MKFGKNLNQVVELSDPEWGPFWMNYCFLKRKIKREIYNDLQTKKCEKEAKSDNIMDNSNEIPSTKVVQDLLNSTLEVGFFTLLRSELKKVVDFFEGSEQIFRIRHGRLISAFKMLQNIDSLESNRKKGASWSRLLSSCVRFYKDLLMLENFAIMNYCGFSKILKKHDKITGFETRDLFMKNVMRLQNFTQHLSVIDMLKATETLFQDIQSMDT